MKARLEAGRARRPRGRDHHPRPRRAPVSILGAGNMEQMEMDLQNMFEKIMPEAVADPPDDGRARPGRILLEQETEALIDPEKINHAAVDARRGVGHRLHRRTRQGLPATRVRARAGRLAARGPARPACPSSRGPRSTPSTARSRPIFVLFIAAGAFHRCKPSDLMPELQGRFPIRVELNDLTRDDFARISREPRASLIRQYQALLATEGMTLEFSPEAIERLPTWRFRSIGPPRTSAPGGCTRSSSACSKNGRSTRPTAPTSACWSRRTTSNDVWNRSPRMKT